MFFIKIFYIVSDNQSNKKRSFKDVNVEINTAVVNVDTVSDISNPDSPLRGDCALNRTNILLWSYITWLYNKYQCDDICNKYAKIITAEAVAKERNVRFYWRFAKISRKHFYQQMLLSAHRNNSSQCLWP